jgi:ribose 1,5-bisphosphokinase
VSSVSVRVTPDALSWGAHGLRYGLPASLRDDLAAGKIVVFNASRAMVATAMEKFPGTRVILVEATPEVRARRLSGRGRETEAEVAARLAREVPAALPDAIRVDKSGALEDGIARFASALRLLAQD